MSSCPRCANRVRSSSCPHVSAKWVPLKVIVSICRVIQGLRVCNQVVVIRNITRSAAPGNFDSKLITQHFTYFLQISAAKPRGPCSEALLPYTKGERPRSLSNLSYQQCYSSELNDSDCMADDSKYLRTEGLRPVKYISRLRI